MKRSSVIWEVAAWTVFFPAAFVLALRRMLGHGTVGPEERVAALLRWYPEAWRARHGAGLSEVLRDTIAERWLVIAAMIAGGLVLIDRSLWVVRRSVRATA